MGIEPFILDKKQGWTHPIRECRENKIFYFNRGSMLMRVMDQRPTIYGFRNKKH